MVFYLVKHGLLACNTWPFGVQYVAFCFMIQALLLLKNSLSSAFYATFAAVFILNWATNGFQENAKIGHFIGVLAQNSCSESIGERWRDEPLWLALM